MNHDDVDPSQPSTRRTAADRRSSSARGGRAGARRRSRPRTDSGDLVHPVELRFPDQAPPLVSVVVTTHARCEVLEQTLVLLTQQDWPDEQLEVLVCDDSADDSHLMVERLAATGGVRLRYLASDDRLPAARRNRGVRAARGELVIFLDDDVWVRPDFVRRHVAAHERWVGPVAVVGLVEQSPRMPSDPFVDWFRPFPYDRIADRAGSTVPFWFHWSTNLSLPRATMVEHDLLFREDWAEAGHDDIELGYRWSRAGFEIVYEPAAWGEHFHPRDLASVCQEQARHGRGLRDLEALVPEPDVLERYGVFSWHSSTRSVVRGLARRALFNRLTVPPLLERLQDHPDRSRLAEWSYWKLMLHHTELAYRAAPVRKLTEPVPGTESARVIHLSPPDLPDVVIDLRDRIPDSDVLDVVFAM